MTPQTLLVDSCVAGAVVRRLRAEGHDVASVAESPPDPGDLAILNRAAAESRIIVTVDTDFGALIFRDGATRVGVLRLRSARAQELADRVSALIAIHGDALAAGAFVTDDGNKVRVSPRP